MEHGFEVGMMHAPFVASAMHRALGEARYRLCLVRRVGFGVSGVLYAMLIQRAEMVGRDREPEME